MLAADGWFWGGDRCAEEAGGRLEGAPGCVGANRAAVQAVLDWNSTKGAAWGWWDDGGRLACFSGNQPAYACECTSGLSRLHLKTHAFVFCKCACTSTC